jgi:hypothetical protein
MPQRFGSFPKRLQIKKSPGHEITGLSFGGGNTQDAWVGGFLPHRIHAGGLTHLARFTLDI